jgi:hypothetical protein
VYVYEVYVLKSQKRRDFTVGTWESLDSTKSGAAGGWAESMPGNLLSLDESLAWLSANAAEGGEYTFTLRANESLAPMTLYYSGKKVSITLLGGTEERTVSLSSNGSLFTVKDGVTLKLGNNITLRGRSNNTSALVRVDSSGKLEMNSGSKISGNANTSYNGFGGGVYVHGGAFIKQSGSIIYGSDENSSLKNTASTNNGHAVYVNSSPAKKRNNTAGEGVTLDSKKDGSEEGWE